MDDAAWLETWSREWDEWTPPDTRKLDPWDDEDVEDAFFGTEAARGERCQEPGLGHRYGKYSRMGRKSGKDPVPNKFGGECVQCGHWVEAGAGCVTKVQGRWGVWC